MIIWSTRYALTKGIKRYEHAEQVSPSMVRAYPGHYLHGEGREWHITLESARKRARAMRDKRIETLRRSLAKLEALSFET